ncbi:lysoplasmalogenase [Nocardioides ferulae]|uniref:lysoplasmalogenase n=1 Tax=Nocardioides ferulae TaxID=2340821 RepID=UPI000EB49E04|nr:lysoplasmalogenase [Nocardioides ferulae]
MPAEIALTACAVPAVVDWWAVARGHRELERWAKPATLLALLLTVALLGGADTSAGRWLLVALAFGLAGDVALLSDSLPRFRAGLAAFLVGHLAYLACFAALGLPAPRWAWLAAPVLLAVAYAIRDVLPSTHREEGWALAVPVAAYSLVVGAMLVLAWLTGIWLVALGATVFVVSDAVLAVDRFARPVRHGHLVVMVTYHVGQGLIAAGVLLAT